MYMFTERYSLCYYVKCNEKKSAQLCPRKCQPNENNVPSIGNFSDYGKYGLLFYLYYIYTLQKPKIGP